MMSDLINRQAAIDVIEHYIGEVRNIPMGTAFKEGVKDGYCRIRSIIMSLPSAERKHGEWLQISPAKIYECSECGQNVMTTDIDCYSFCHGCGADMRGDND